MCYLVLWEQWQHNCSPAASFANCVMTLYLLKVHMQTFLSIPVTQKCQILSCDNLVANEQNGHCIMWPTLLSCSSVLLLCVSQGMCILVNILRSVLTFTHHILRKFFLWGGGQGLVLPNSSHIPHTFLEHQSSAGELMTLKPGVFFFNLS